MGQLKSQRIVARGENFRVEDFRSEGHMFRIKTRGQAVAILLRS